MVTDVYSHIIDDDCRKNAELFENAFYQNKDTNPKIHGSTDSIGASLPEGVDPETHMKVLKNPKMAALLQALVKSMG